MPTTITAERLYGSSRKFFAYSLTKDENQLRIQENEKGKHPLKALLHTQAGN